jgi:hypothetical protein
MVFALVCVGATAALLLRIEQESLREALVERQRLLIRQTSFFTGSAQLFASDGTCLRSP